MGGGDLTGRVRRAVRDMIVEIRLLPKIADVRKRIERSGKPIWLEVDGGIKTDNIADVARAGADTFVAGSAIFGSKDYAATIRDMRDRLAKVG